MRPTEVGAEEPVASGSDGSLPEGAAREAEATARARALSHAGLVFALVAPLTYLAERLLERARSPLIDPGQVLIATHLAFVWRAAVAAWFGLAVAWLAFLRRRDAAASPPERPLSLALAVLAAGLVIATAAAALP